MKRLTGPRRVVVLAVSALLCAIVSAVASLGRDVGTVLASSWSRELAIAIALAAGLLGFAASLLLLWDVNLAKAIPLVFVVTVLAAATVPVLGAFGGLIAGVLVMQWCCRHTPWGLQPSVDPTSVFRKGLKGLASRLPRSGGEAT